ncbi:elongation factor Ts [Mycoplasmoides gallisepticum]|uniref:Elongation factor Ts n=1 Tax=Mycoplasmoides gallisepticum TaxID=2096 RepID=A0AB36DST8_MYCGL|nr:elongation factor Ts [Mycoplasmoides gallisepticum]OBU79402.1 elongation factor Ts [Mycoplasmoides gallisepticum]OBU79783.1 elongation factor Ts [Mycoplasmoides gallisepticum]OBZ53198.1 elongation factor Ts [Mycoplasmoides gallisepticum]OBZ53243.1 elongation factor Ts [Mycoplasmoides gallisepticum]
MIDNSLTIEKLLSTQNSQLLDAVRYTVGEGIEK